MSAYHPLQSIVSRGQCIPLSCSEFQLLLHCQIWAQTGVQIYNRCTNTFSNVLYWGPDLYKNCTNRYTFTNIQSESKYKTDYSLSQIKCQTHPMISSFKQLVVYLCWFQHHANIWPQLLDWMRPGTRRVSYGPLLHTPLRIPLLYTCVAIVTIAVFTCVALIKCRSCYIQCEPRCLPLSPASFIAITGAIVPPVQSDKYFHIFNWNRYFRRYLDI